MYRVEQFLDDALSFLMLLWFVGLQVVAADCFINEPQRRKRVVGISSVVVHLHVRRAEKVRPAVDELFLDRDDAPLFFIGVLSFGAGCPATVFCVRFIREPCDDRRFPNV